MVRSNAREPEEILCRAETAGGRLNFLPMEKDSINGPAMIKYLAMIAACVGDNDLACEQLADPEVTSQALRAEQRLAHCAATRSRTCS